jgi:hypothetical protein
MTRRGLLQGSAALAMSLSTAPLMTLLSGCGGGGGGGGGVASTNSRFQAFTVLPGEFGGGGLALGTPLSPPVPFASGTAVTRVENAYVHLVHVLDDQGKIRAMSLAGPADSTTPAFGAESTAAALLMCCSGVIVVDPGEVRLRVADFKSRTSFWRVVSQLRVLLPSLDLGQALKDADLQLRLKEALEEFYVAQAGREIIVAPGGSGVTGTVISSEVSGRAQLGLSQLGWRTLGVFRHDLTASGKEPPAPVSKPDLARPENILRGFALVNFGDLFLTEPEVPGELVDPIPVEFNTYAQSRYTLIGPGFLGSSARPSGITRQDVADIWAINLLQFVLLPFFAISSFGPVPTLDSDAAFGLLQRLRTDEIVSKALEDLGETSYVSPGWTSKIEEQSIALMRALMGAAIRSVAQSRTDLRVGGTTLVSASRLPFLTPISEGLQSIIGPSTLQIAYRVWGRLAHSQQLSFIARGDTVVTVT